MERSVVTTDDVIGFEQSRRINGGLSDSQLSSIKRRTIRQPASLYQTEDYQAANFPLSNGGLSDSQLSSIKRRIIRQPAFLYQTEDYQTGSCLSYDEGCVLVTARIGPVSTDLCCGCRHHYWGFAKHRPMSTAVR